MKELIVTVGPSSISHNCLLLLKEAGATSFRINLSHSNPVDLSHYFDCLLSAGISPAIDTQGPQIRVSSLGNKTNFLLHDQFHLYFGEDFTPDDSSFIAINHREVSNQLQIGDILKVDFSGLVVTLTHQLSDYCWHAEVISPGNVLVNRAVDVSTRGLSFIINWFESN